MSDKMERLFDYANLDEKYHDKFKNCILDKIIIEKETNVYNLNIYTDKLIDSKALFTLLTLLRDKNDNFFMNPVFILSNVDNKKCIDYLDEMAIFLNLDKLDYELTDNLLIKNIDENKFNTLCEVFKNIGFKDLKIRKIEDIVNKVDEIDDKVSKKEVIVDVAKTQINNNIDESKNEELNIETNNEISNNKKTEVIDVEVKKASIDIFKNDVANTKINNQPKEVLNNQDDLDDFYLPDEAYNFDSIPAEIIDENKKIDPLMINKKEVSKINTTQAKVEPKISVVKEKIEPKVNIEETKLEAKKTDTKPQYNRKFVKPTNEKVLIGEAFSGNVVKIKDIIDEANNIIIEGCIYGIDLFESNKSSFKIITLKVTDYTDSIYVKIFCNEKEAFDYYTSIFKNDMYIKINGYVKNDIYAKDLVLNANNIMISNLKKEIKEDNADVKRVELKAFTTMTTMDSVISVKDLINRAKHFNHSAVSITDTSSLQSFPYAYANSKDIKILFGATLNVIDDNIKIFNKGNENISLLEATYVVFDFETTGFNATNGDSIIEVGAVKIRNGEVIDTFSELIDPNRSLPPKITEITGITNSMLKGKRNEEEVMNDFIKFYGDDILVAHNAKFDVSFIDNAYNKYNFKPYKNTVIDTLELSRYLDKTEFRHSLSAIVKRYDIPFDENIHHRALYDAEATAKFFHKMLLKLNNMNMENLFDLNKLIDIDRIVSTSRPYNVTLHATNNIGLKNLFKIVSLSNTKYFHKSPRILKSELIKNREGIIIGSGNYDSELIERSGSINDDELTTMIKFYDYVEVQPLSNYFHLIETGKFRDKSELKNQITRIIDIARNAGILVCATGDVHHLDLDDKIYREIIINQKVPGGGLHPLNKKSITNIPSTHFRTTDEMLDEFEFLGSEIAYEIVVTNTNLIKDMIGDVEVVKKDLYAPKMDNSVNIVREETYKNARAIYGEVLPKNIENRIEQELSGIINGGYDVIYLIAQKLVSKSNDDGYIVGSRGSVGSSIVATFLNITEVNPLPAHYVCPNCKNSEFNDSNNNPYNIKYKSGFDLPSKKCSCGAEYTKEGHDIPFSTFLGFDASKTPDIDLNFSGDYQPIIHNYTKELFGEFNVFRAGTIATVATKTAFGFAKGYFEDKGMICRNAEVERLALGITGVKRTSGQHPGGIIVIPDYMDVLDFTPYQYPADDTSSSWYTTHFDFHSIEENVLKLDLLGHDDPTVLKMLESLSNIKLDEIPFDDPKVISLFRSVDELGVTKEQILVETGTLGVPEFGTYTSMNMLLDVKPKTFADIVKVSGLAHGTNVWNGNQRELLMNNICTIDDVFGCREDIISFLERSSVDPLVAFKIMEFVRKGKARFDKEGWAKHAETLESYNVPKWYIDACGIISYLFPKAHATAYVMMAYRVAWFKLYYKEYYYASLFSIRYSEFDIEAMLSGYDAVLNVINEINNKGYSATNKESSLSSCFMNVLEALSRGIKFSNISLYESDSNNFIINDKNELVIPFRCIEGLGSAVSSNIVYERKIRPFLSVEDFKTRVKASTTLIEKLDNMGVFKDLPKTSQLTLDLGF